MAVATGSAGLLAAIRWTQAKGVDFGAPMIATQAGAFIPGLMTNLFRGFDVTLLITAPMLLGVSPWWSLVLASIVAAILLNSMDAEALRARQAETAEAARAAAQAARRGQGKLATAQTVSQSLCCGRLVGNGPATLCGVTWDLSPPRLYALTTQIDDPGPLLGLAPGPMPTPGSARVRAWSAGGRSFGTRRAALPSREWWSSSPATSCRCPNSTTPRPAPESRPLAALLSTTQLRRDLDPHRSGKSWLDAGMVDHG